MCSNVPNVVTIYLSKPKNAKKPSTPTALKNIFCFKNKISPLKMF